MLIDIWPFFAAQFSKFMYEYYMSIFEVSKLALFVLQWWHLRELSQQNNTLMQSAMSALCTKTARLDEYSFDMLYNND